METRTNLRSVTQSGSGDTTFREDLQNVSQTGSGDIIVHGNVAGNVTQMGSGDIKIIGSVQGSVTQMGSGDIRITGDVHGYISQMGSGTVIIDGNVYGQVSKLGSGDIHIRRVRPNVPKLVSETPKADNDVKANVQKQVKRPPKTIQDNSSLLKVEEKELECPVCLEIPDKEIYQCKNGHMICAGCSSKIDTCPQCRCNLKVDGALIRNRLAENLVAKK